MCSSSCSETQQASQVTGTTSVSSSYSISAPPSPEYLPAPSEDFQRNQPQNENMALSTGTELQEGEPAEAADDALFWDTDSARYQDMELVSDTQSSASSASRRSFGERSDQKHPQAGQSRRMYGTTSCSLL